MAEISYPLPIELVDHVFTRLTLSYGQAFLRQYDGITELEVVKADWAIKLATFGVIGEDDLVRIPAIDWALDQITDPKPPNVLEFRRLCAAWKDPNAKHPLGLPAPPRPVPEGVRKVMAQLAAPLEDARPEAVRVAYRVLHKYRHQGVRLSPTQQEWIKHSRAVVDRYEADMAREEAAAKQREASHAPA